MSGLRLSLRFKFAGLMALMIAGMMAAVGAFVFFQQREDLGMQVRERGATIARNLASNAAEAMLPVNPLDLALMVRECVQTGDDGVVAGEEAKNEGVRTAFVVGTDGFIKAHSDSSKTDTPYQPPAYLPQAAGHETYPLYLDGRGHKLYDISVPIEVKGSGQALGWVHLSMDRGIIDRVVQAAAARLAAIALAGLLAGVIIMAMAVSWLVRPVGQLVKGALAIAGGDFDQELRVNTADELGDLTQAFNGMALSLREKQHIESAFSRYVSATAMKEVLEDPSKGSIHGKRIEATVYFSDVRGFTAMSETMQPEEVVKVINEYLGTQTLLLAEHGGSVNKFVGDATMAIFGLEESRPDDPLRAVQAALKIQAALKKDNEKRVQAGQVAKEIGIGINTGEMVVGNMGSSQKMEHTVMGENVVLSDRLCAVCKGGEVLISESTYQRVKDKVKVQALERNLEGKKQPVRVYVVTSLS